MALNKQINLESGHSIQYHRISQVSTIPKIEENLHLHIITVESYKDEQSRLDGKKPARVISVKEQSSELDKSIADLYAHLKSQPEFDGSSDI
jgi:hypothetical protein